jgi:hypothetical protein
VKIYQDKNISDQTFVLEEVVFVNCVLKNCDLFYSGGDFEFLNLKADGCRFHFPGPAKSTQILLQSFGMLSDKLQPLTAASMSSQIPN